MAKIMRDIFIGDKEDLCQTVHGIMDIMDQFAVGTKIYIAEAPSFRQVIYDFVSRGFNALGFFGVIDAVILVDDEGTVKSIILIHGYDDMGQLSTETIWPLPKDEQASCAMPPAVPPK